MNKSKNSFGSSRVQSNLLQQNCFVRDVTQKSDVKGDCIDSYVSLDEVTTSKGVELRKSVEPYHITPKYVDSFADSADYRRDPLGAVSNSVKRQNLGDITDVQRVAGMDTSEARALYERLKSVFDSAAPVSDSVAPVSSNSSDGGDK